MQKAKDQRYNMLQSSSELGWSNLFAEVRSYGRGKWAHPAEPETKITILLDGSEGLQTGGRVVEALAPETLPVLQDGKILGAGPPREALSRPRFLLVKRARRPSAQMSKINNLRVRPSD